MATTQPSDVPSWPLGELLKAARKRRNIGIPKAAQLAGVSQGQYHAIERGRRSVAGGHQSFRPSVEHVIAAARAVHVDPREALTAAGYEPAIDAPDLEASPSITADELAAKLRRLTPAQRAAVLATIDAMLDPGRELPDHGVLFKAEIDEDVPQENPGTSTRRRTTV